MGEIACNQTTLDNILIIAHQGSGHKTHFNNNCINIKDKYTTKLLIFYRNRDISLFGAFYHSTLTFPENKFQKSVKAFFDTLTITTNSLSGDTFCSNYVKFSRLLTFGECSLLGVLP